MTAPCGRPDCPTEERRVAERRQVHKQSFAWCARVVSGTILATSFVSIGSAVSISSYLTERMITNERRVLDFHQQQYHSLSKRVGALETRIYEP